MHPALNDLAGGPDGDLPVYAVCQSYFHVAQILALCSMFHRNGHKVILKIYCGTFLGSSRITAKSLKLSQLPFATELAQLPETGVRFKLKPIARFLRNSFYAARSRSVLISPNGPHIKLLLHLAKNGISIDSFYSIEDGVGSYGSVLHRARANAASGKRATTITGCILTEAAKYSMLLMSTRRSGGVTETIGQRPGLHKTIRIPLRDDLRGILGLGVFGVPRKTLPNNTALFLSQPLVELRHVDKEEYISAITRVQRYFGDAGFEFVVKPHPAEDVKKFQSFNVAEYDGPVEVLLSCNGARIGCVVGTSSTALLLASNMFNLKCYKVTMKEFTWASSPVRDEGIRELLETSAETIRID